jgi:capsid protein
MWVDPMKDMNAAKMAVDNGWKTNTQVASDMGTDFDENLEEYKREKAAKSKAGFVEAQRPGAPAQPKEIEGNEDEKQEQDDAES